MLKKGLKIGAGVVAVLILLLVVFVTVTSWYVSRDKTEVFQRLAGEFDRAEVLENETGVKSHIEFLELYNQEGAALVTAYKRVPRELADDYFVLITYAGRRTGREVLNLIPERDDVVLVSMQYPYYAPDTARDMLFFINDVRLAGFKTVAGGKLMVDYLEHQGYNSENITVVGASLGAFFATIHGALDERVPRVLAVHGGGDFRTIWRHILNQREEWLPDRFITWFIDTFAGTFDPIHYVDRIAPREFIMLATRNDHYFPDKSFKKLYKNANEPKHISWSDHGHVRTSRDEIVEAIVEEIKEYLEARRAADFPDIAPRPAQSDEE